MKQFGVLTKALNNSQAGMMLTHNLNQIVTKCNYIDPIVFYREYYAHLITPMFAMMQDVEAWSFPHPVIATNFENALQLIDQPLPTKKFFYVMDLEWLYMSDSNYDVLKQVYTHKDIHLIARSDNHARILKSCWKEPVATIENFDYREVIKLL